MRFDRPLKAVVIGTAVGALLAILLGALFYALATVVLPGKMLSGDVLNLANTALPYFGVAAIAFGVMAVFASMLAELLSLLEVLTSRKETTTKILWIFVIFLFGVIGIIAYYLAGRKEGLVDSDAKG